MIVDYQRKLRESSESLNAAEEHSRKLTMQVSVVFGKLCYSDCCQCCCLYLMFGKLCRSDCSQFFVYTFCSQQVSVLKLEKDMLANAEKRACDEVHSLSERVHRLQVYVVVDLGFILLLLLNLISL